jgi:multidrug efflux system membrane fusion protein
VPDTSTQVYAGVLQPRTSVDLAFSVGGYVQEILQLPGSDGRLRFLQSGDHVSKGTVLARVRLIDYQSRVQQAEAQINGQEALSVQARYGEQLSEEGLSRSKIALVESITAENRSLAAVSEAKAGLAAANHQVDEAVSSADLAKTEYDRANQLYTHNALPKADYDRAKTQYDVAQTRVQQAEALVDARKAEVEQSKQVYAASKSTIQEMQTQIRSAEAQVHQANAQYSASAASVNAARAQFTQATLPLDDALLKAPIDGVILKRIVEVGSLASPGVPCFTLADMSSMKAVFGIPDTKLRDFHLGQHIGIQIEALPGRQLTGIVTSIASDADPASRVYPMEVTISNAGGVLKSGMIAKLVLKPRTNTVNQTTVPLAAVFPQPDRPDQFAVYTIAPQPCRAQNGSECGIAQVRSITIRRIAGDSVVVSQGLTPGEQVISTGAGLAYNGARVVVVQN